MVASVPHCQLKHCHWLTRFESSVARLVWILCGGRIFCFIQCASADLTHMLVLVKWTHIVPIGVHVYFGSLSTCNTTVYCFSGVKVWIDIFRDECCIFFLRIIKQTFSWQVFTRAQTLLQLLWLGQSYIDIIWWLTYKFCFTAISSSLLVCCCFLPQFSHFCAKKHQQYFVSLNHQSKWSCSFVLL